MTSTAWMARKACEGADPALFFPQQVRKAAADTTVSLRVVDGGRITAAPGQLKAGPICNACPVAWDCLAWAIRTKTTAGVFGGIDFRRQAPRPTWDDKDVCVNGHPWSVNERRRATGRWCLACNRERKQQVHAGGVA